LGVDFGELGLEDCNDFGGLSEHVVVYKKVVFRKGSDRIEKTGETVSLQHLARYFEFFEVNQERLCDQANAF
jgi:hypothetical protein